MGRPLIDFGMSNDQCAKRCAHFSTTRSITFWKIFEFDGQSIFSGSKSILSNGASQSVVKNRTFLPTSFQYNPFSSDLIDGFLAFSRRSIRFETLITATPIINIDFRSILARKSRQCHRIVPAVQFGQSSFDENRSTINNQQRCRSPIDGLISRRLCDFLKTLIAFSFGDCFMKANDYTVLIILSVYPNRHFK